jgi:hypothetical protein
MTAVGEAPMAPCASPRYRGESIRCAVGDVRRGRPRTRVWTIDADVIDPRGSDLGDV